MSEFQLIPQTVGDEVVPLPQRYALWRLSRDDAATLWYALDAYKRQLLKDATAAPNDPNTTFEEEAFLYTAASHCARLQFELRDDHEQGEATVIRTWLDTD